MQVALLGPVEIRGGPPLEPRDRLALGVLALRAGEPVAVDEIAEVLWPGGPPSSWQKQVQICISRLRKKLGPGAVETVPAGYRLVLQAEFLDTLLFARLADRGRSCALAGDTDGASESFSRALALWRGPPFVELDAWPRARSEAARLEEQRRTLEEDLVEVLLAAGEHRAVAVQGEALVRAEPLRERRWAQLALAQYRCGRQADALGTLRKARQALAENLGIDPGRELVDLELGILRQDPSLDPPTSRSQGGPCPWPGLAPYGTEDASYYFGREAEVAACVDRLLTTGLLVVSGPSGSGKSSLVRAGIIPELAHRGFETVLLTGGDTGRLASAASAGTVVVVDQLEEMWARDDAGAEPPVERLLELVQADVPVVVTVRSHDLSRLVTDSTSARAIERSLFLVGPMSTDALRDTIEGPAAQAGLRLGPGLTDLLLQDAGTEPGALPLLSHALAETWERREGNRLGIEGYVASGAIRGAVAASAELVFESLSEEQREVARSLFLRLVAPSGTGDVLPRRLPTRSLSGSPQRQRVVGMLVRARLLTIDEDQVVISHESLTRAWPRLRTWLEEDATRGQVLRHLESAAQEWDRLGRPEDELYRGVRLQVALDLRPSFTDLDETEDAFLCASRERADRAALEAAEQVRRTKTENSRLRVLVGAVSTLLVVALVATTAALRGGAEAGRQRDLALSAQRRAELETLVNQSLAARASDRGLAALLAVEAHERHPGPGSLSALVGTFTAAGAFVRDLYLPGRAAAGVVVPGSREAVVVVDADLAVLDIDSGSLDFRFPQWRGDQGSTRLAVSADGRVVARLDWSADEQCRSDAAPPLRCGRLSVLDLRTGQPRTGPAETPFRAGDVALSPDGSLVALAGEGGIVEWYDTSDGHRSGGLPARRDPGRSSDNGTRRFDGEYDTAAVVFDSRGRLFAGTREGVIRSVDPRRPDEVRDVQVAPGFTHTHLLAVSDDVLLAGGDDGIAAVDPGSLEVVWTQGTDVGLHPERCPWLAASAPLGRVYCGSYYGVVEERDVATGRPTGVHLDAQHGSVGHLDVTRDGRTLVAFGAEEPVVSEWRLDGTGAVSRLVAQGHVVYEGWGPSGAPILVAPRPATATRDVDFESFALWDVERDRALATFGRVVGLGRAGREVLTGHSIDRDRIEFYDSQGEVLEAIEVPPSADHLWPSSDGTRAYVGFPDGEVWTLDPVTRRRLEPTFRVPGSPISVSATRGGSEVVITSASPEALHTYVFSGATADVLAEGAIDAWITSVSLDGTLVGARSGRITRYDLQTLEPAATFPAARGEINSLQFSEDGRTLLATSNDQSVSLYDVATGTRLGDPIPSASPLIVPGFLRPDGDAVAVTTERGVAVWDLSSQALVSAACRLAGRDLTRQEWASYMSRLGPYRATCASVDGD